MNIIDQWINELGLVKLDLHREYYNYQKNDVTLLVDINEIEPMFRDIKREYYVDGLKEQYAKNILLGISQNASLPPIEVYSKNIYLPPTERERYEKYNISYNYILFDGYHRFNISKFLGFRKIPITIKTTKCILDL
jgi:hypothetical protein